MTSREERVFLDQIIADPDDDTSRLVFADWLEESGDTDRAEFIRVQIQRASLPKWDARQLPLLVRECALLKSREREWKSKLAKIESVIWGRFRRGFVATATITDLASFHSIAEACGAATPMESLSIDWPDSRASFDDAAPIAWLKELTLRDSAYIARDEVNMIAYSPILASIETLNVGECNLGALGVRPLLDSHHLTNLSVLRVPYNSLGNQGLEMLMGDESLSSLVELDISEKESYSRYNEDPSIDETGLLSFVDWPGMNRIRSLNLSGNNVGTAGLYALLQSEHASQLKELILRDNGIRGDEMVELDQTSDQQLDVLDLGENYLGDHGARFLSDVPSLSQLKMLKLDRCELPKASASTLTHAPFIHSLRRLNVNENNLGPAGLLQILRCEPGELHTLQIAHNDLLNQGAEHLATAPASARLQAIDLSKNRFDGEAAEALAASDQLGQLQVLRLDGNKIDASAAAKLLKSEVGSQLVVIDPTVQADEGIPFDEKR